MNKQDYEVKFEDLMDDALNELLSRKFDELVTELYRILGEYDFRKGQMSVENGKVCCNCRYCIRSRDEKHEMIVCNCEVHNLYLCYEQVMSGWCRHWAKEQEDENG